MLLVQYCTCMSSETIRILSQSAASPTSLSPGSTANRSAAANRSTGGRSNSQPGVCTESTFANVRSGGSFGAAASLSSAGDLRRQSIVEEDETSSVSACGGGGTLTADGEDGSPSAAAAAGASQVDVLALCKDGLSVCPRRYDFRTGNSYPTESQVLSTTLQYIDR